MALLLPDRYVVLDPFDAVPAGRERFVAVGRRDGDDHRDLPHRQPSGPVPQRRPSDRPSLEQLVADGLHLAQRAFVPRFVVEAADPAGVGVIADGAREQHYGPGGRVGDARHRFGRLDGVGRQSDGEPVAHTPIAASTKAISRMYFIGFSCTRRIAITHGRASKICIRVFRMTAGRW